MPLKPFITSVYNSSILLYTQLVIRYKKVLRILIMLEKLSGHLYQNSKENCVMTTMVMSSAIKPSDYSIGKQSKGRGKLQDNQEMQWVFLTTAKRRNSIEEQKLVRVDDKPLITENATCTYTEEDLKVKYSQKWLKRSRSNKGGIHNPLPSGRKMNNRNRFQSLRLPRQKQSIDEPSCNTTTLVDNNVEGNTML